MDTQAEAAAGAERAESYRAAARAAAAELAEIEDAALALQARLAGLRARERAVTALLHALREVVPDAVPALGRWAPAPGAAPTRDLPRRLRRQAERVRETSSAYGRPVIAEVQGAEPVRAVPAEPLDEVRVGVVPDVFAQPRTDVQAWG